MYAVVYTVGTSVSRMKLFSSFEKAHRYLVEVSKEKFRTNVEIVPGGMIYYSSDPFNNEAYQMIEVEDCFVGSPGDLLVVLTRSFVKEKGDLQKVWAYDCPQYAYQDMQKDYSDMLSCLGGVLNNEAPSAAFITFKDCSFYTWRLWFAQFVE